MNLNRPILLMAAHHDDSAFWEFDRGAGNGDYRIDRIFNEDELDTLLSSDTMARLSVFLWVISSSFSLSPSDRIAAIRQVSSAPVVVLIKNNSFALEKSLRIAGANICLTGTIDSMEFPSVISHNLAKFARDQRRYVS